MIDYNEPLHHLSGGFGAGTDEGLLAKIVRELSDLEINGRLAVLDSLSENVGVLSPDQVAKLVGQCIGAYETFRGQHPINSRLVKEHQYGMAKSAKSIQEYEEALTASVDVASELRKDFLPRLFKGKVFEKLCQAGEGVLKNILVHLSSKAPDWVASNLGRLDPKSLISGFSQKDYFEVALACITSAVPTCRVLSSYALSPLSNKQQVEILKEAVQRIPGKACYAVGHELYEGHNIFEKLTPQQLVDVVLAYCTYSVGSLSAEKDLNIGVLHYLFGNASLSPTARKIVVDELSFFPSLINKIIEAQEDPPLELKDCALVWEFVEPIAGEHSTLPEETKLDFLRRVVRTQSLFRSGPKDAVAALQKHKTSHIKARVDCVSRDLRHELEGLTKKLGTLQLESPSSEGIDDIKKEILQLKEHSDKEIDFCTIGREYWENLFKKAGAL